METSTNNSTQDFNFNEYKTNNKKVSWITRKLWWSAGADEYFLERSPKQDQVKYAGIGGIVLATGLLAAVSGWFAFKTIIKPETHLGDFGTVILGIIWGIIIFNLDRFIVSSTGKGDGTDSISWKEFIQAFPRIIIAIVLGFAISAPLEIRILQTEIDAKLKTKQDEFLIEMNKNTDKIKSQEIERVKSDIKKMEKEILEIEESFEKRRLEIKDQRRQLELEAEGATASKIGGRGPAWRDKNENLIKMEAEVIEQKKSKQPEIIAKDNRKKASQKELERLYKSIDIEKNENRLKALELGGLLERIDISHEIGGIVPWVILAVFLCIEMGPIFFKMMMTKGPYDYMVENYNYTLQAENGLFKEDKMYEGRNGMIHMESFRYIDAELAIHNQEYKLQKQKEVDKNLIDLSSERKLKDIKENPDKYIG